MPAGFKCLTWKGYAYCKTRKDADELNKTENIDSQLKSHETIHIRQAQSTDNSWLKFYVQYTLQWIKNLTLITVNIKAPYKFMPMEMEAYLHQDEYDYCENTATQWRELKKIKAKTKKQWAKEYYKTKPYYTDFLKEKLNTDKK